MSSSDEYTKTSGLELWTHRFCLRGLLGDYKNGDLDSVDDSFVFGIE